ncbi:MAG: hypothetical protein KDA75_12975 [Planctomycetaceae bacterium]|nr:hypothetical protein [Planctomycetaceae bacterium]
MFHRTQFIEENRTTSGLANRRQQIPFLTFELDFVLEQLLPVTRVACTVSRLDRIHHLPELRVEPFEAEKL